MRTITATEFKNRAAEVLKEVAASGETVLVTRRGKPLVRVEPVSSNPQPIRLGAMQGTAEILGDLVSPVFEEWETLSPRSSAHRRTSR